MAARLIVFGPTGNVGSIAARTAQQHGVKVFLAMRNIQKSIPDLSAAEEVKGGFERVEANLLQPKSVLAAVRQTKATSASMYLAWESADHMRASLQASKEAGITFIVFLSSFTIQGDLRKVNPGNRIPYSHAQVELNLEEIYGSKNYVAIRAGAFATNTLGWRTGISSGEVTLGNPGMESDLITPTDMGRVAGTFLAKGQQDGQHIVYLYGPRLLTQREALKDAITALGKNMIPVPMNAQQQHGSNRGSRDVIVMLGPEGRSRGARIMFSNFDEHVGTVRKYTGQLPTEYKEWVESDKARWTSE